MDDAMEMEVHVNSNVNSSKENASSNENVDNSDNDNVTKLKVKHSDCNNTNQDASDVTNSVEGHDDDIPSEINDTNNSDVSEINNLHCVKNLDANSLEDHDDTSECNKNDELKSELNDSDHVGESIDNLSNSIETNLTNSVTEKINTTPKPSTEATVTEDTVVEKKIVEKLKENNADNETQDNVSIDTTQDVKIKIEIKEEEEETETKENHEVKKKEESGKKKKGKICVECGKKKKIEFRIHFQGKVHTLCSETCYKQFKTKQSTPKAPVVQPKVLESVKESPCPQCQKNITANQGYYPVVGDIKPLCSEECVRKYQDNNGPPRKCSQCSKQVEDKSCHLSWETMVFCSEDCLGKYQSFLGSHCTCCQAPVQQASLGKYCVCFGSDIRQFCSGSCLDDFKKGLKVCTFCQTDLSAGTEGFLAPVGDKGQFKDFCSQACMERYEVMNNLSKTAPEIQECAHCKKQGSFKIQVPYNDKKYFLCCDNCVAGLRCTLKKTDNVCASCHHFYTLENDVKNNNEQEFKFKLDGLYKFFCSKTCMTTYVLSHRRITQCQFCKVKKYNFDMIEKTDRNIGSQIFCSLNCLSLYRVNVNAASAKSIRCDNCSKNNPAQYHLTMSDGSIRNFCTYTCVLAFQNQFTSVPALTTTSMTRQMTTTVQTLKTTSAISSPIIANVMSLAQPRPGAPSAPKPLVPQTLVSVRPPQRQPVAVFTTKPQNSTSTITSPSIGQPSIASSQVMREVIVQPPAPKSVKNKTVSCKPIMQTKGVNAKTPACHKAVQTDENPRPVILPVPIPVYVPTPLHMFSRPVPCPVPFPVPIPIPIIINSSKEPQNQVIKHLKKIQGSVHTSSQDELSNTSYKSIDDSNKSQSDVEKQSDDVSNDVQTIGDSADEECENDGESDEPQYYIKQNKSNHKREHSSHKHKKHKKIKLDEEIASEESADTPATEDEENNPSFPSAGSSFSVKFSQPGTSYQQSPPRQNNVFETPNFNFEEDEQTLLKMKYGMNALKLWILKKNATPLRDLPYAPGNLSVKRKFYKTDILVLPPAELESYLIQFVQEARNDSNTEYSGGALYFLCLSIQLFLLENGKTDNIFTDSEYENFARVLHNILIDQETKAFLNGQPLVKNKEEILWDTDQLGVQSPLVLLNTLIFFYTKYFRLKTVEDHAQLRFSNVVLVTNNETQTLSLRYYPSGINHNDNGKEIMEIKERPDRLIRCPVKLYEFYLQRCPPQALEKSYPLYLEPEKNCSPERDVWFSPYAMSQELINRQLQRLKFIEEANI